MKHIRLLIVAVCLLGISSPAWALLDDDAKLTAAKELTQLLGMTEYYKGGFTNGGTIAGKMAARDNPGKEDQVKKLAADAYDAAYQANKDQIEANNAKVYADTYSLDEMQQLIVFFKTPVGQKLVLKYRESVNKTQAENDGLISTAMKGTIQKLADDMRKDNLNVPREAEIIMRNYAMVMNKGADNKQCLVK